MNKGLGCYFIIFILCFLSTTVAAKTSIITSGPDGSAFYNPPTTLKPGKHGDVIWVREIESGVPHSKAWKVLYWSSTINDEIIPISGLIIAPDKLNTNRPIVTWG